MYRFPHFFPNPTSQTKKATHLTSNDACDLLLTAPIGTYYFRPPIKENGETDIVARVQIGGKSEDYCYLGKFIFSAEAIQVCELVDLENRMTQKILTDKKRILEFYEQKKEKDASDQRVIAVLKKQIECFKIQPITDWLKNKNFDLNYLVNEQLKDKVASFLETPIAPHKEIKFSAKNLANSMQKALSLYRLLDAEPNELTSLLSN